jgi:hypothetical protein
MAKTTTVASIENGTFRARQKAVQLQIQQMNHRENKPLRKPTITKVVVPPLVYIKRQSVSVLGQSISIRKSATESSAEQPVIRPLPAPAEPASETEMAPFFIPLQPPSVPVEVPAQSAPAEKTEEKEADGFFAGFTPLLIDHDEETLRLQRLMNRAMASRNVGVDRAIASLFRLKRRGDGTPVFRSRQSLLSIPIVKSPLIHQMQ